VPTTPNPTSGYFLVVPKSKVRELDMSVDEALKYIISMGSVIPRARKPVRPKRGVAAPSVPETNAPASS